MTSDAPSFLTFKVCVAEPVRTCVSKSTFQSNAMCSEATSCIFDWVVVSTLVSAIEILPTGRSEEINGLICQSIDQVWRETPLTHILPSSRYSSALFFYKDK